MTKEEFNAESSAIKERAAVLAKKNKEQGLFSLEDEIDKEKYYKRDILDYGLGLIIDGTSPDIIDKILTNIVNLETDADKKALAELKKKAVLEI